MFIVLTILITIVLLSNQMQNNSFMDLYPDTDGYTWITNERSQAKFFGYSRHKPEHIQFRGPHSQGNMLSVAQLLEQGMIGVYLRTDIWREVEQRVNQICKESGFKRIGRVGYGRVCRA